MAKASKAVHFMIGSLNDERFLVVVNFDFGLFSF